MFEPPSTTARLRGQGTPRSRRAAAPAFPVEHGGTRPCDIAAISQTRASS